MFTDKNPFGDHPVATAYQNFKNSITDLVTKGKMDHITAAEHFNKLNNFATEQQHDQAADYIKTNMQKLKLTPKENWFKEEKWGK